MVIYSGISSGDLGGLFIVSCLASASRLSATCSVQSVVQIGLRMMPGSSWLLTAAPEEVRSLGLKICLKVLFLPLIFIVFFDKFR